MYNLRSRNKLIEADNPPTEDTSLSKKRNRHDTKLGETKSKRRKIDHVEPEIFNPKLFRKGNHYRGIYDSSDSDSDTDEYVRNVEEDEEYIHTIDESQDEVESSNSEENEDNESEVSIELDDDGQEDNVFDPDSAEYFDIDKNPLIGIITKRLKDKFPDLSTEDLNEAVKNSLKKANSDLVEEYCGAIPKDSSWKAELDPDEIEILEPQLKELRKNIRDNVPTIPKILKSGLSMLEKQRALQLYDALKNTEPYTLDYMYLSMKITDMIRTAMTPIDSNVNDQLQTLRNKMEERTPTVEKIIAAKLTQSDKMRALRLYEALQQCSFNTEDWFDTQRRINNILDAQLESDEAVAKLETEEASLKKSTVSFTMDLKRKIFELDADPDVKARLYEMYNDMMSRGTSDSRYADLKDKIMWAIKLPYRRKTISPISQITPDNIRSYCADAYRRLDAEIYGMKEAKMRVIQTLNDRIYNPGSRAMLALKGKPGVGKTKLAKVIAKIAGRPFDKISLGGAIDSTIFKGSDNVWSGSAPSLLLQILSKVKYSDAVILLDEFDKLGSTDKGIEVQNALLHVLDPSQNKEFQDSFLNEFPHDISNVWFIPAMNDDTIILPALRDRLDIIEIPAYSRDEMVQIIKLHTLPEAVADKGMPSGSITITDEGARQLLQRLGYEVDQSGMRPIEKAVNNIVSRLNFLRTMHTEAGFSPDIPLTYKLKDFHGLPYTITAESINVLHVPPKSIHLSYII